MSDFLLILLDNLHSGDNVVVVAAAAVVVTAAVVVAAIVVVVCDTHLWQHSPSMGSSIIWSGKHSWQVVFPVLVVTALPLTSSQV